MVVMCIEKSIYDRCHSIRSSSGGCRWDTIEKKNFIRSTLKFCIISSPFKFQHCPWLFLLVPIRRGNEGVSGSMLVAQSHYSGSSCFYAFRLRQTPYSLRNIRITITRGLSFGTDVFKGRQQTVGEIVR